jgi:hypothetical protein
LVKKPVKNKEGKMEDFFYLLNFDKNNKLFIIIDNGPFNSIAGLLYDDTALRKYLSEQEIKVITPVEFDEENEEMTKGAEDDKQWPGWGVEYFKKPENQKEPFELLRVLKKFKNILNEVMKEEYNKNDFEQFISRFESLCNDGNVAGTCFVDLYC